jgi:hypothetical protein
LFAFNYFFNFSVDIIVLSIFSDRLDLIKYLTIKTIATAFKAR